MKIEQWIAMSLVSVVLGLPACGGIEVLGAVPMRDDGGFCVVDREAEQVTGGRFDASFDNAEFQQGFLIEGGARGHELNRVEVSYGSIEQSLAALMEGLGRPQVPAAGHLGAAAVTGLGLTLIPRDIATVLRTTPELADPSARVTVLLEYQLLGGRDASDDRPLGPPHTFSVEVCNGCLACPDGSEPTFPCGPGSPPMVCP